MAFRTQFLIDECLSPKLVEIALDDADVTHVNFRGLASRSDSFLTQWCIANNHIMVTNNARDFRRIYARMEAHPGLVILVPRLERPQQLTVISQVLPRLAAAGDLINTLVEIGADGGVTSGPWPE